MMSLSCCDSSGTVSRERPRRFGRFSLTDSHDFVEMNNLSYLIAALLVTAMTAAHAEQWKKVGTAVSPQSMRFIDLDSVAFVLGVTDVRIQTVHGSNRTSEVTRGRAYSSEIARITVDCVGRTLSLNHVDFFNNNGTWVAYQSFTPVFTDPSRMEGGAEVVSTLCQLPSAGQGATVDPPPTAAPPQSGPAVSRVTTVGSGFLINGSGQVVTNDHVVPECNSISVIQSGSLHRARLLARDPRNDLAVVEAPTLRGSGASIRSGAAQVGEEVLAAGFPLAGLLATDVIVTNGIINALAGLEDDPSRVQISAPVQPGNSGGPLLDRSGNVVGVVVEKLNATWTAKKFSGDIPQNVNFAIKPEVLRLFLEANRLQFRQAASGPKMGTVDLASRARQFTVKVECF
jgi:S1-C subfamily serine protease